MLFFNFCTANLCAQKITDAAAIGNFVTFKEIAEFLNLSICFTISSSPATETELYAGAVVNSTPPLLAKNPFVYAPVDSLYCAI